MTAATVGQAFDVAVVGAGMLGAASAYRLSRAGLRVIVLEAGAAAGRASGNSFAWLNALEKQPEAYHRLNAAGMAGHDALASDLGQPGLIHRGGAVRWADGVEDGRRLEALVERLSGRGYTARWISRDELATLEPALSAPAEVERIAHFERDAWVDAPAVVAALLGSVREQGEVLEGRAVTGFATAADRVTAVETAEGAITVGSVLVCAGTQCGRFAGMLDARVPVERRAGLLAITEPLPEPVLSRVLLHRTVHVRPDVGGGVRMGADDVDAAIDGHTPTAPLPPGAAVLLERAATLLPALAGTRVARVHIGVRPMPADGHTIAGRLPGWRNAYVAVTHSGITLGPLLGRLMADEIAGGAPDPMLAPFRPDRFATAGG